MKSYTYTGAFALEKGGELESLTIAYHTFGKLNADRSNVIWVCHALTANSDVSDWWSGLFGKDNFLDPSQYFIVCANVIGSCYGSTGPTTPLLNRRPLLDQFPEITIRDMVRAHQLLANYLGLNKINVLIGASLGGQQALEWAVSDPEKIEQLVLIATNAVHSAYGRAFNESQRLAILADPSFGVELQGGRTGLIAARSVAMLSYRSYTGYKLTQSEVDHEFPINNWNAASYQRYQGEKLANRFSAYSYYRLTQAMDSHDVGRNRFGIPEALKSIKARTHVIGIASDGLFPVEEQYFLAEHIESASFAVIESDFGHDGFLIESDQLKVNIGEFLRSKSVLIKPKVRTQFKNRINNN